jgi:hypothetical protein
MKMKDWPDINKVDRESLECLSGELYNLETDPAEKKNLAKELPMVAQELDQELHAWRAEPKPEHSSAESPETDPVTKEALKSLGYGQ